MKTVQKLKFFLVSLGPRSLVTQAFLKLYASLLGYRIYFKNHCIKIIKSKKQLIIKLRDYAFIPIIMKQVFDNRFEVIEPIQSDDCLVLDFSMPATHCYKRCGISFMFLGIPEDDSIDAYTSLFKPKEGMVVFDVGAGVGSITYFLSQMVGEQGKVYAFEPDDKSRECLEKNIIDKKLNNITILDTALAGQSGIGIFNMDGSMAASLVQASIYPNTGVKKEVGTLTLEDCCQRLGVVPNFIKMDIEGSEVEVIARSLDFLQKNPIHFAFDSCHKLKDGSFSYEHLENLFRSINYSVRSQMFSGEMFTFASPSSLKVSY
ncbi:MAG: FkbM family methyltransferase [Verrucomicrobiae bacterium]|nr:FkbM family methyltransferase [Verrucomicrobiae bacterium]